MNENLIHLFLLKALYIFTSYIIWYIFTRFHKSRNLKILLFHETRNVRCQPGGPCNATITDVNTSSESGINSSSKQNKLRYSAVITEILCCSCLQQHRRYQVKHSKIIFIRVACIYVSQRYALFLPQRSCAIVSMKRECWMQGHLYATAIVITGILQKKLVEAEYSCYSVITIVTLLLKETQCKQSFF